MNDRSDGPGTGPVPEQGRRPDRPAASRSLPSDEPGTPDGQHRTERVPFPLPAPGDTGSGAVRPAGGASGDGVHRTEQVPFPLPPLPAQGVSPAGPETGRLYLGGYPPRVPGPVRRQDAASQQTPPDPSGPAGEATGRPERDEDTGGAAHGR